MRPIVLTLGILFVIFGGYPPFNLKVVLIGLVIALFGLFSTKKVKK